MMKCRVAGGGGGMGAELFPKGVRVLGVPKSEARENSGDEPHRNHDI